MPLSQSNKGRGPGTGSREYTVGVISDTHGLLRPQAIAALRGSDYIIHARDVGDPAILTELSGIAPITAVRGNVDRERWARDLPATNVLQLNGVAIYVLHDLAELDLDPRSANFAAVIFGHSHRPSQEMRNGVLFFNPGAAGPRRFTLPVTIGRLGVGSAAVSGEILTLSP